MKKPIIKFYIKQILEGLKYLHENQIVHRDRKALCSTWRPKLSIKDLVDAVSQLVSGPWAALSLRWPPADLRSVSSVNHRQQCSKHRCLRFTLRFRKPFQPKPEPSFYSVLSLTPTNVSLLLACPKRFS